jgi:hypothetical protein
MSSGDAPAGNEVVLGSPQKCQLGADNVALVVAEMRTNLENKARAANLSVRDYVAGELEKLFDGADVHLETARKILKARANAMLSGGNKLYKVTVTETRLYKVECLVEAPDEDGAGNTITENGTESYVEKEELVEVSDVSVDDVEEVSAAP